MEVWHRQKVCLAVFQPTARRNALTLRAMSITAGIIGDALLSAVAALLHMAAKGCRAAGFDGTHNPQLITAQMPGVGLAIFITMAVKNIGNLQRGTFSWRYLAKCRVQAGGTTSRFSRSSGLSVAWMVLIATWV